MRVTIRDNHKAPQVTALLFSESAYKTYSASGRADKTQGWWKVKVHADGYMIIRDVSYEGKPWDPDQEGWQPEGVIWPAWPARSEDQAPLAESPLAGAQDYWAKVGGRLRDSAKWMATVLGAALAAIVGTAPLTVFAGHHPNGRAVTVGLIGVAFLYLTLVLGAAGHAAAVGVLRGRAGCWGVVAPIVVQVAEGRRVRRGSVPALRGDVSDESASVDDYR